MKMENVLIDDKRIHVDFSQSVSKLAVGKDGRFIRNFRKKNINMNKQTNINNQTETQT